MHYDILFSHNFMHCNDISYYNYIAFLLRIVSSTIGIVFLTNFISFFSRLQVGVYSMLLIPIRTITNFLMDRTSSNLAFPMFNFFKVDLACRYYSSSFLHSNISFGYSSFKHTFNSLRDLTSSFNSLFLVSMLVIYCKQVDKCSKALHQPDSQLHIRTNLLLLLQHKSQHFSTAQS